MDWKKYLPLGLIVAVILYAIYKLSGSKSPTQIINRAVQFNPTPALPDTRDPYRAAGFQQLASLAATTGAQSSALEQGKLAAQTALSLQQDRGNNILAQLDLLGRYKAFDIQQQISAQNRLYDRQEATARRQSLLGGLAAILNSIRPSQQSRGGSSGGSSGGLGSPPFNPGSRSSGSSSGGYDWGALSSYYNDFRTNWFNSPEEYATPEFDIGGLDWPVYGDAGGNWGVFDWYDDIGWSEEPVVTWE